MLLSLREAYVEWRREALRGRGDDFCDEQAGFGCSKHVLNTFEYVLNLTDLTCMDPWNMD